MEQELFLLFREEIIKRVKKLHQKLKILDFYFRIEIYNRNWERLSCKLLLIEKNYRSMERSTR